MILNKKYKCPVCLEKCITLRDRFKLDSEISISNILNYNNYITCRSCNAKLIYKKTFDIKSIIISILYLSLLALWFISKSLFVVGVFFGMALLNLDQALFGKLEEYIPPIPKAPQAPKFNLNKFLDGLRNTDTKKSL